MPIRRAYLARIIKTVCIIGFVLAALQSDVSAKTNKAQTAEFDGSQYLVYKPTSKPSKTGFPLVLFLHGAGQRGSNIEKVQKHGPPKILEDEANVHHPLKEAYVLVPQCPAEKWWQAEHLMKLVRDFIKSSGAPIDQNRVYVTGLSMGGFATWNLISKYPHFFAAAIPICGGYDVSSIPYPLKIDNPQSFQLNEIVAAKHLPIWTFHGDKDTVVPISQTERLVKRLRRSGTTRLIFTIYKDTTHNSWERSYDNWLLYNWLFSQVRKP